MNNLPNTIFGTLNLFPETKSQQDYFVSKFKNEVLGGEIDPLKAEAIICNIESVCKKYRADKELKSALLNETEKYGKTAEIYGAKFTVKEAGVKYDFSSCNRPDYERLAAAAAKINADLKELENELKSHKNPYKWVDIETGEACECYPPARTSTTIVAVEIKK